VISRAIIALVVLLLAAHARAQPLPAAGDDRFGWFVIPFQDRGGLLHVVPAGAPPGTVRRAVPLPKTPEFMGARAGALYMLFPPLKEREDRIVRQARRIGASAAASAEWPTFTPLTALPPMIGADAPYSFSVSDSGPVALRREDASHIRATLWRLGPTAWSREATPAILSANARSWVCTVRGRAAIVTVGESGAELLTFSEGPEPRWDGTPISVPANASRVFSVGDQLVAVSEEPSGAESIHVLRTVRSLEIARLDPPGGPRWIVPVGDTLSIFSSDDAPGSSLGSLRLRCRVLSLTGLVLYDGPARTAMPVDRREIEALAVLFVSVLATIAVFVLRPAGSYRIAVAPPDGFALAEPSRRSLAAIVDLAAALLVACLLWRVSLVEALSITDIRHTRFGIWPLVTAGALTVLHASISEALTGRTLGKSIFGCRTVNASGANPSFAQAFARNLVKTACPPLGLVSLMTPGAAHPAAFGTLVVIPVSEEPVPPDAGP